MFRFAECLVATHHRHRFELEVHVGLAAHVDDDPLDRAARELPWLDARVVEGDGCAALATDVQALAAQRELAELGLPFSSPTFLSLM